MLHDTTAECGRDEVTTGPRGDRRRYGRPARRHRGRRARDSGSPSSRRPIGSAARCGARGPAVRGRHVAAARQGHPRQPGPALRGRHADQQEHRGPRPRPAGGGPRARHDRMADGGRLRHGPDAPAVLHFHEPYLLPRTYWGRKAGRSVLDVLAPEFEEACAGPVTLELDTELVALRGRERPGGGVTVRRPDGTVQDIDAGNRASSTTGGYAGEPELFPQFTGGASAGGTGSPEADGSGSSPPQRGRQGARAGAIPPDVRRGARGRQPWETVDLDDFPGADPAVPAAVGDPRQRAGSSDSWPRTRQASTCGRTRCSNSRT